jgi:hypothetical protein
MYSTSHSIRITSAALAVVFGLGLVATAGGALREDAAWAAVQLVKLDAVVITPDGTKSTASACESTPKAAL